MFLETVTKESIQRAKQQQAIERAEVVRGCRDAADAALMLLDLYPDVVPALRLYIELCDQHGTATMERRMAQAMAEQGTSAQHEQFWMRR